MSALTKAIRHSLEKAGISVERLPHRLGPEYHTGRVLGVCRVDGVIDVGANEGQFGRMVRQAGCVSPIVSFEPQSGACQVLRRSAVRDSIGWQVHQVALSDEPGALTLNLTAGSTASSFLSPRPEWEARWPGAHVKGTEEVPVARLDDFAGEFPWERTFLKVDTQGYDMRVLAGAPQVLERVVALQVELSVTPLYDGMTDYIDALQTIRELGFTLSGVFPAVLPDDRMHAVELDGIFVRP